MKSTRQVAKFQQFREAEGYLDLLLASSSRLSRELRIPLATRALKCLDAVGAADCQRSFYLRGQALRLVERYGEAVISLQRAAELVPGDAKVWLLLAWCYKRCHRIDLAIDSIERALRLRPDQAVLHYNLACYWSLARNVHNSVTSLLQALELNPAYRERITVEPDFDAIRAHYLFQSALQAAV